MNKINFAIIGCGRIAQRHAEHINTYGNLLAVCDTVQEKALTIANKYNAIAYTDIDKLLQTELKIDVVAICSPNGLHASHAIKALNSGFHVICEKPIALNIDDCGSMIMAAEKNNKLLCLSRLMTSLTFLFLSLYRQV